jgi:superfamily I DNA/RNA helicase
MLAVGMMKEGGRLVAVGDAAQAIYGFCGADADALDLIVRDTNAIRLPLTVTYRCPKKVVDVARRYVNHITAHESAPEGSVIELNFDKFAETVKPGDAVLCRLNAPNLRIAYSLISAGVPARIEGREIGTGLKTLVKRWKVTDFDTLRERLDVYREREIAKLRKKNQIARIQAVEDRVECVNTIIDRVIDKGGNPIISVCDEIERIFGAENSNVPIVTLSSIHKAKGREWKRVFWLQTGDARWATKQWMKDQEKNLCYVAATRAMDELYTVDITDFMK